jgi:hypothetical protein
LEFLEFLSGIPTSVWAALAGGVSGIGTWIVGMRQVSASIERARLKINADASAGESAERAAFRAALMADVAELRRLIKECDADRDLLRCRVNTTEEQILVLKASNEIMERWLAFFKNRNTLETHMASGSGTPARRSDPSGSISQRNRGERWVPCRGPQQGHGL